MQDKKIINLYNLLKEWRSFLSEPSSDYKKSNILYKRIEKNISELNNSNLFPIFYHDILKYDNSMIKELSGFLRIYEPKIIQNFYQILSREKLMYKISLDKWEESQKEIEEKNLDDIDAYNDWKNIKKDDYKLFVDYLNTIVKESS